MELIKTFRNPEAARKLSTEIHGIIGNREFKVMEVCGGQTHTIYKYRLRELLPEGLELVSGPGCPVCVTPISYIDKAVKLALVYGVTLFTFGDLMRVPGTHMSLEKAAAEGADIQAVYSPLQSVSYAEQHPDRQVVFLGIGFETTAPHSGLAVQKANGAGLGNFSVLLSAKRVPPVLEALLSSRKTVINGFITPGHVTSIIGLKAYDALCSQFDVPMVCGGFEPLDLLIAIRDLAVQFAENGCANLNAYGRVARYEGNIKAQALLENVFETADDELRGFGIIPGSGYKIRGSYARYDAETKFDLRVESVEPKGCICGLILSGLKRPGDCPLFGKRCMPDSPVGSCMVSNEGACSAAWLYGPEERG